MQFCNSDENARSYIGVTSRIYIPARPMSNFSFSVRHLFQFRFWPHRRNWQVILRQHATFHQYRITHVGDMTSYRFPRWRPLWRNFTSLSDWLTSLLQVNVYQHTKYRHQDNSIHGWGITTSVLEKQTSAILEFYLRFWSRPLCRNLHVILHQATEFRPSRSTRCENMTPYPFLKMTATAVKYYFRFHICWCRCFQNAKTKFRRHISIHGWDITTSLLEKQTSAILEFYFRFRSRPLRCNLHVVWALHPKNQCDGSTWRRAQEKKYRTTKKSQKCYISPIWGKSPHWTDSTQKLHGGWCLRRIRRNHVCQVSKWNLHGLRFYRRSNFRFSYWFLHFATVQR